jgi:hypothetical protein
MAKTTPRLTRRALIGATATAFVGSALAGRAITAPRFTPYPNLKAALQSRQTGLFRIAELGIIETILLCVHGAPIEVHARRNGIYQRKDAARSRSLRDLAPVDFNRLISAAGGLDTSVNGTSRAISFYALYNTLAAAPATEAFAVLPASGDTATRLVFSTDPFFSAWSFAHDPKTGAYAFTAGDIRAHWSLERHP